VGTNGSSGSSGSSGTSIIQNGTTDDGVVRWDNDITSQYVDTNLVYDGTLLSVTGDVNLSGDLIASGEVSGSTSIHTKNFVELYSTLGTGGSTSIDLTSANNFEYTVNATSTIAFTNSPTAPKAFGFTLVLNNGGSQAITWPTGTLWAGGIAPALTASGTDILVFYTYDGGVSYYGFLTAVNLS
jgi:hypothetical protein